MPEQPVELNLRLATLSDEALLQVATVDREKYTPESVSRVTEELRRRGVTEVTPELYERVRAGARATNEPMYGGFWRRLASLFLDLLVLSPFVLMALWVDSFSRFSQACTLLPNLGFSIFYHVGLVQRFGGTPGKLLMRLNITKLDGTPVGWREAWLRFLPDLIFSLSIGLSMSYASFRMTEADQALAFVARTQRRAALAPGFATIQLVNNLWVWSEFLVLLTNRKRRALHDFLAGTVVVRRPSAPRDLETELSTVS
ncbi:MAG TPA: RDD family protein [Candidatus Polarisedimenticolia bacterium]|nr:RDD family protein [Candidatus Polarisedimenticolia bacterium]